MALPDEGVAAFKRRLKSPEAQTGVEPAGQMVVGDEHIAQAAAHERRRVAVQDIIGRRNIHVVKIGLRPMLYRALEPDTLVQNKRHITQILTLDGGIHRKLAAAGHDKPPPGTLRRHERYGVTKKAV